MGYVEMLRGYLGKRRNVNKKVYKIMNSVYRGEANKRFTYEEIEKNLRGRIK